MIQYTLGHVVDPVIQTVVKTIISIIQQEWSRQISFYSYTQSFPLSFLLFLKNSRWCIHNPGYSRQTSCVFARVTHSSHFLLGFTRTQWLFLVPRNHRSRPPCMGMGAPRRNCAADTLDYICPTRAFPKGRYTGSRSYRHDLSGELMGDNLSMRFIPARVLWTPGPAHIPFFLDEKTGFRVGDSLETTR